MKQRQRAFTLIEVMAAMAILAIALVVLIKSQTQSITNVHLVDTYERAIFITENQLHWTLLELNQAESWDDLRELEGDDLGYHWKVTVDAVKNENVGNNTTAALLNIVATTSWGEGPRARSVELETMYLWGEGP